jgi:hypothetical protein
MDNATLNLRGAKMNTFHKPLAFFLSGLIPIKVAPTIRGLVGGRDEILEAAVKFLQGRKS